MEFELLFNEEDSNAEDDEDEETNENNNNENETDEEGKTGEVGRPDWGGEVVAIEGILAVREVVIWSVVG